MKPSGNRRYVRESEMQRAWVRFENWSMEFLVLARLRGHPRSRRETDCPQLCKGHGVLAISQYLDTRSQPIYAWAGGSPGKLGWTSEALLMCKLLV